MQGDNIYSSRDSRQFGPVPYGLIQGRAFCKVSATNDLSYPKLLIVFQVNYIRLEMALLSL